MPLVKKPDREAELREHMAVNGILGKKVGMTQLFDDKGEVHPVTVLKAGPCVVTQRKTVAKDGYDAAQIGLVEFVKGTRICGRSEAPSFWWGRCLARLDVSDSRLDRLFGVSVARV